MRIEYVSIFGRLHYYSAMAMSLLIDRTQEVFYDGRSTATRHLYGVPQGSLLGPLLFSLYTADISTVVDHHGLQPQQYVDDCQLYVSRPGISNY